MSQLAKQSPPPSVAVAYLARGAGNDWLASCERFLSSYTRHSAGIEHRLWILFKGFPDAASLSQAQQLFSRLRHESLFLADDSFDIGAYIEWANHIDSDTICPMNTASEILSDEWLAKLAANLSLPNVGLVGASASYESLNDWNDNFPIFPNIHLRSNGFMLDRELFCRLSRDLQIRDKLDAFNFESGSESLTRRVAGLGLETLLVGRNGRGYAPEFWPVSDTFRLGFQNNLLIGDNQTRNFSGLSWNEKREFVLRTWGHFIRDFEKI
jgi:hypothetical protein